MPFDYMHTEIPRQFQTAPEKARAMYMQELRERAAMLRRLGYSEADVLQRLQTNVEWDWEANPAPEFISEVKEEIARLVREVYAR